MKKFVKSAVLLAAAVVCGAASASTILDPFLDVNELSDATFVTGGSVRQQSYDISVGGQVSFGTGGVYAQYNPVGPGLDIALGGYREVYLQKTAGQFTPGGVAIESGLSATTSAGTNGSGRFSFSTGTDNAAYSVIRWDGAQEVANDCTNDTTANGPCATGYDWLQLGAFTKIANLRDFGNAFAVTYTADLQFEFMIQAWDTDGDFVSQTFSAAAGTNQQLIISFDDFITVDVDETNIAGVQVVINPAGKLALDVNFATTGELPEPSTLMLAGLALLGAGAKRFRGARKS